MFILKKEHQPGVYVPLRALFLISFFDEIRVSNQNSPRWVAVSCGVTSGAILFAYVPLK